MIATPQDLRAARRKLGWSIYEMADHLRLGTTTEKGGQKVREMEAGSRSISGPVAVAVEQFLKDPPSFAPPRGAERRSR